MMAPPLPGAPAPPPAPDPVALPVSQAVAKLLAENGRLRESLAAATARYVCAEHDLAEARALLAEHDQWAELFALAQLLRRARHGTGTEAKAVNDALHALSNGFIALHEAGTFLTRSTGCDGAHDTIGRAIALCDHGGAPGGGAWLAARFAAMRSRLDDAERAFGALLARVRVRAGGGRG